MHVFLAWMNPILQHTVYMAFVSSLTPVTSHAPLSCSSLLRAQILHCGQTLGSAACFGELEQHLNFG